MRKLLFFRADWCDPCNKASPLIEDIFSTDEYIQGGYSGVERINIDEEPERASRNGIHGLPTFIIVNENYEEIARHEGLWSGNMRSKLIEWLGNNR